MDLPSPYSNGSVSVPKYSSAFMNTFLWYFFQTLTVSSMLLMVLSIFWTLFSANNNIRVVCVIISVAFAIICPIFIVPNLPRIAAVAIPILGLNRKSCMRMLNISAWMFCGYVYPLPLYISCYSLIVGFGLLKMYGDGGPGSLKFMNSMSGDATYPCLFMFNNEMRYGTGRWVDSGAGWALLGLIVMTMLAYFLPPIVEPKKKKMLNDIKAILTEVVSEKMVNVAGVA